MRNILRTALLAFLVASGSVYSGGCASTSSASKGPVELDGSKWKLVISGGKIDGRVIQFKKRGQDGYEAKMLSPGIRLRDVVGLDGLIERTKIFSLRKKNDTEYEGMYKEITSDGGLNEHEVVVFVNGDSMTWNLESAQWERVE